MDLLNSIRHKILLARGLSLSEWFLMIQAWWLLLGFYLALRRVNFTRLKQWLPRASQKKDPLILPARLKQLVDMSARLHVLTMTCLVKSLTLRWMLISRGQPSSLRIGVMKTPAGMQAHAWIELNNIPLGEAQDIAERFKIMESVELFGGANIKLV
jgi:hypothetical protein